jgi:hypothetical protein
VSSPYDPDVHAHAQEDLAALAFGEIVAPAVAAHVAECGWCQEELAAYRRVVELVRLEEGDVNVRDAPPASVWEAIVAAVAPPAPAVVLDARRPLRRAWLAAAAAVLVLAAGAGGWALGRGFDSAGPSATAHAALRAQRGTPPAVHGTAVVHRSPDGFRLDVDTIGLPLRTGYYEVWLYDRQIKTMVAIGTLGTGGRGTFTVPAGIDLQAFDVLDVSAQNYDGNPAHQRSVLQGPLTR